MSNFNIFLTEKLGYVINFVWIFLDCRDNPMLTDEMPDLLPELRPYQRRAVFWMVQREKRGLGDLAGGQLSQQFVTPLCTPVDLVDSCSTMYYNSFRYKLQCS